MVTGVHISGENYEQNLLFIAIKYISKNNPSNTFIVFTTNQIVHLSGNCIQINISPKPKNRLMLYYWYSYKLPGLLLKYGVNSFITDAGMLAGVENIKQYLFFSNTVFEKDKNVFFKKKILSTTKLAENIFVTNEYISSSLIEKYHVPADKIKQLHFDLPAQKLNISFNETEENKALYADGFDYFLFEVSKDSAKKIITVLKAFSQFKKWQKSSMKMVLLLNNISEENLINDFKNYKYRNDVKIIIQTQENVLPIIASAFTALFFGTYAYNSFVFSALQNNIPVIAGENNTNKLLFKNAVVYTDESENPLAAKMQLLYKDELQKNGLLQQVQSFTENYHTANASQKLFEIIAG